MNENMQLVMSGNRLQMCCARTFSTRPPAAKCIFGVEDYTIQLRVAAAAFPPQQIAGAISCDGFLLGLLFCISMGYTIVKVVAKRRFCYDCEDGPMG